MCVCWGGGGGLLSLESDPDERNVLISYANAQPGVLWVWRLLRCSNAGVVINCFVVSSSSTSVYMRTTWRCHTEGT